MVRVIAGIAALLFATSSISRAQVGPSPFSVSKQKVFLVELFTSEGCSSCPPADALLRQINGSQPGPGELIVGVSEHVTYWNSLGWKDPFSASTYTDRQNAYGTRFGLDSVYTPQMILNGADQFVGSDRSSLLSAIRKERSVPSSVNLRILSSNVEGNSLRVRFSAVGDTAANGSDIIAVLADDFAQSNVERGENSGRTLTHVAVAFSLERIGKLNSTAEQEGRISFPPSMRTKSGQHLILFAQAQNTGRVLGATSKGL